jgi:two-component system sensor histidine kinase PilS (NtrC family)
MYVGRQLVAFSVFVLALVSPGVDALWRGTTAAVPVVLSVLLTAGSLVWTEVRGERITPGFLYLQFLHDFALLTVAVHLTGGGGSQLSALYILWMSAAALLLPIGGSLLLATLASVLFVGDAILLSEGALTLTVMLQLVVFTAVAFGTGAIALRLQAAGEGRELLAAELALMQRRAGGILATLRAGVITVDGEGHLRYVNPAASALLGIPLADWVGRPVESLLRPVAPMLAEALLSVGPAPVVNTRGELRRADGSTLPIGITTAVVRMDAGAVDSTTVIVQGVADLVRMEELRLKTNRLEAVAEIGASMAHEIKNPLASIQSAAEQVGRLVPAVGDVRVLTDLMVGESERLARLLREFLDFARAPKARLGRIDLRETVRAAVSVAGSHPDRAEGVRIDVDLPETPVYAAADADLLHRVCFNLALNAIQATPSGGRVTVGVRALGVGDLPVGLGYPTGAAALDVRDGGPGIAPEIRDRLFEPFATTRPGGSGLGLAIVHRAVEAHGGTVLVESDATGAHFRVLLPLIPEPFGGPA